MVISQKLSKYCMGLVSPLPPKERQVNVGFAKEFEMNSAFVELQALATSPGLLWGRVGIY